MFIKHSNCGMITQKMKLKTSVLMVASVLAVFLALALVSAATTFTAPTSVTFTSSNPITIAITNPSTTAPVTITIPTLTINGDANGVTLTPNVSSVTIVASGSSSIILTPSTINWDDFTFGKTYSGIINLSDSVTANQSQSVSVSIVKSYCDLDIDNINSGKLKVEISSDDPSVSAGGFGDAWEWYPGDNAEVDITVDSGTSEVKSISVEWALYSESGKKLASGTEPKFSLDSDSEDLTLNIKVDPDKLKSGEDAKLYVSATGKVYPDGADSYQTCSSKDHDATIITDDVFAIIDNMKLTNTEAVACGDEVEISGNLWNLDSEDRDLYLLVENSELKISQKTEVIQVKDFDSEAFTFSVKIPQTTAVRASPAYKFIVSVYDSEENSILTAGNDDNDEAKFELLVPITESCTPAKSVVISNPQQTGGKTGSDMVVKLNVANSGSDLTNYKVNAAKFTDWADSAVITGSDTLSLGAGQSSDVTITFKVKDGITAGNFISTQ